MTSFPPDPRLACRSPASSFERRSKKRSAFTLIETALALGIVAFALVPIIGLLPIGLQTSRNASDLTISAQIAQRLAGMVQQTDEPTSTLANGQSTLMQNYYYFDGEGQPVGVTPSQNAGMAVPATAVYAASIQVPKTSTATLVNNTVAATLDVQIVNDPGHVLQGNPSSNSLPLNLQSRAIIVPVYLANNGT